MDLCGFLFLLSFLLLFFLFPCCLLSVCSFVCFMDFAVFNQKNPVLAIYGEKEADSLKECSTLPFFLTL